MTGYAKQLPLSPDLLRAINQRLEQARTPGITGCSGLAALHHAVTSMERVAASQLDVATLLNAVERAVVLLVEADREVRHLREVVEQANASIDYVRDGLVDALGVTPDAAATMSTSMLTVRLRTARLRLDKLVDIARRAEASGDRLGPIEVLYVAKHGDVGAADRTDEAADPAPAGA